MATDSPPWVRRLLLMFIVIAAVVGAYKYFSPEVNDPPSTIVDTHPQTRPEVGKEVRLAQQVIFTSESALKEARQVGDNKRALVALMMSGQVIGVDSGTRVMVLDYVGGGIYRIRVIDGEMIGRTGYVPEGFFAR